MLFSLKLQFLCAFVPKHKYYCFSGYYQALTAFDISKKKWYRFAEKHKPINIEMNDMKYTLNAMVIAYSLFSKIKVNAILKSSDQ